MRLIIALSIIVGVISASPAFAALKSVGKGDSLQLDISGFPNKMKERYLLMKVKCAKCHTLERTIVAVQTGIAPISGQMFDRSATRAYGIKMLRKPNSDMTKQEVKEVVELLNFLIEESEK